MELKVKSKSACEAELMKLASSVNGNAELLTSTGKSRAWRWPRHDSVRQAFRQTWTGFTLDFYALI
jgi:hypothetical protein